MKRLERHLAVLAQQIRPVLKKYHIQSCAVFGSFARGDQKKESDIDFLITPPSSMTLFDLSGLHDDLEHVTRRRVDIVTRRSLHPALRQHILRDVTSIYES